MINWFEIRKFEGETNSVIDWRAKSHADVLSALRSHVTSGRNLFAGEAAPTPAPTPTPTPTPTQPATAPAPAQSLTASAASTKITLAWQFWPSTGTSAATQYVACLAPTTGRTLGATATSTTFSGLPRRTSYTLTVTAGNSTGSSQPVSITTRTK